jgi:ParB family chromosome partitioning protein
MDPNDLELVVDPSHPLYDRRVHQEPNPKTVLNYRAIGVRKPVLFYKDRRPARTWSSTAARG